MRRAGGVSAIARPARLGERDVRCPVCGAPMIVLANHRTSELFWSCVLMPRCRGRRRIAGRGSGARLVVRVRPRTWF